MITKTRVKKTKEGETREVSYGRNEILNEFTTNPVPERDLWSAVILQAISNIQFRVPGWETDFFFICGGMGFDWICEQLGLNKRIVSQRAIKIAFTGEKGIIKKH